MRTTANVKLFNFHDPTQNSDFGMCCGKEMLHLQEKLVDNQCLEMLRLLVPPSSKLKSVVFATLANFQEPIYKSGFNISHTVKISNFP